MIKRKEMGICIHISAVFRKLEETGAYHRIKRGKKEIEICSENLKIRKKGELPCHKKK